ncbi:LLM class flavin-dependent oxidoreductase [Rhodococcus rhodochrous]|uniref:Luciferase-like monooxygenase n=1 Tax=Rhodococcus rhodochrous J45 TaxID=935266 RepID=A0A562E3S3_RHORH|nr:LLM class flavin-dependent oxidoreductase [Rhodococcus rhodochrous]MCB8914047.1 LLM class flavin-dependent oxidoreductase [Rhodococcus rhodochrous]TWH16318.1 luciferase-like monooxygenase [Rhodococcus rhodochrous J45]
MTSHPARRPIVAVGLTGEEALRILDDAAVSERWAATGATFGVIGIDRIARNPQSEAGRTIPRPTDIDPSLAATALAGAGGPPLVVTGAAHHDLPYNLARRVLSLDHLTHGRTGLLFGARDPRGHGETAWHGGAELGAVTAADAALAIARLWQSWPLDSIVADKESGILVQSDRIRRVDHHGVVDIAGPLSAPASVQGAPVLAWYADDDDLLAEIPAVADLVVVGGVVDPAGAVSRIRTKLGLSNSVVLIEIPVEDDAEGADTAVTAALDAGADGVLLRSAQSALDDSAHLLDRARAVSGASVEAAPTDTNSTLRVLLGLGAPAPLLESAAPAFTAPTTSVYR